MPEDTVAAVGRTGRRKDLRDELNRLARYVAFAAVVGLALGVLGSMTRGVVLQLRALDTATSDNLQWTLAQVDAEFLQFRLAIEATRSAETRGQALPAQLEELRKRFDIFYSRVDTFRSSATYARLRRLPEFETAFRVTTDGLAQIVPLVDGPDAPLAAALPRLEALTRDMDEAVRTLSLTGLSEFARESDSRREAVTQTLIRLALVTVMLLLGVSLLAMSLLRLYRLSEARRAEQQLTSTRLQTIVETSLDGIIVSDHHGRVLEFNPAAESIFGWTREEALGRDLLALTVPEVDVPRYRENLRRYVETGVATLTGRGRVRLPARRRDGSEFPSEMSIDAAEGADGVIFVTFVRDISRRVAAEEELLEARDRALAGEKAKAEFVAVMSHEMRTPLNGLLGTVALLKDTPLEPRQRRLIDTMETSGRLLVTLVNDVLDLSKFEAGKMQIELRPFHIGRLVEEIVANLASLAAANGNALSWSWIGPAQDMVLGDAIRLRQMLLNLVGNAIKFTEKGTITVEVEALGPPGGRRDVEFRVIDTGIGIPEEDLERVFQDFETLDSSYGRKAGGTGLGLGIARRLARLMGGEIGAESEPGAGSLFWIRLPFDPADETVEAETRPARPLDPEEAEQRRGLPVGRALSVLIVEDNEINRAVLREMVEAEGHAVTEAVDGGEGVRKAGTRGFDLILMDVSMPVMDGQQATRAIRAGGGASAQVPIVGVTAHALPEEIASFRAAGMDDCISKPIDRAVLIGLLGRIAGDHSPSVAAAAQPRGAAAWRVLDHQRLAALAETMGPERFPPLLGRYLAEAERMMAALAAAGTGATSEDEAATVAELHRLAGSSAAFGAEALHKRLLEIEVAAKAGDRGPLLQAPEELPRLWQRARAAIAAWQESAREAAL